MPNTTVCVVLEEKVILYMHFLSSLLRSFSFRHKEVNQCIFEIILITSHNEAAQLHHVGFSKCSSSPHE